jgi:CHASE2 domain-containing sensor protein
MRDQAISDTRSRRMLRVIPALCAIAIAMVGLIFILTTHLPMSHFDRVLLGVGACSIDIALLVVSLICVRRLRLQKRVA